MGVCRSGGGLYLTPKIEEFEGTLTARRCRVRTELRTETVSGVGYRRGRNRNSQGYGGFCAAALNGKQLWRDKEWREDMRRRVRDSNRERKKKENLSHAKRGE